MIPPKIVLLIGKKGEQVQAIRQSLAAHYQVVTFQRVERELAWFNPLAVIIYENGSPRETLSRELRQLRQLKPDAPVLLCRASSSEGQMEALEPEIADSFSWPTGLPRLKARLEHWEQRVSPPLGRASLWWKRFWPWWWWKPGKKASLFLPSLPIDQPELPMLKACFLGGFSLAFQGSELPYIRSETNRAMLACLLLEPSGKLLRRKALNGFWPDSQEEAARNCLNVAMSSLRRYLRSHLSEEAEITFRENAYHLSCPGPVWNDAAEMLKLWERAKVLERAGRTDEALNACRQASLIYQGDFLAGVSRQIDWVESVRNRLRETYLSVLDRQGELLVKRELYYEAEAVCHKILEVDDCIESAHRHLMRCYFLSGRRGMAIRQFQLCKKTLKEKLGAEPFEETDALYHQVMAGKL